MTVHFQMARLRPSVNRAAFRFLTFTIYFLNARCASIYKIFSRGLGLNLFDIRCLYFSRQWQGSRLHISIDLRARLG